MADSEQKKAPITHLVHYSVTTGHAPTIFGTQEITSPKGWTIEAYQFAKRHLTEKHGARPLITGVTAFDRPTIDLDAVRKVLSDLADTLDAGASPAIVATGLRRIVQAIQ